MKRWMIAVAFTLAGCDTSRQTSAEPPIVRAPSDVWCTELGNCFESKADCDRADKGTCTRYENYACMTFTTRTANDKMLECWKTYGECKTRQSVVERNPELKAIEVPCVIFRKDG